MSHSLPTPVLDFNILCFSNMIITMGKKEEQKIRRESEWEMDGRRKLEMDTEQKLREWLKEKSKKHLFFPLYTKSYR